MKEKCNLFLLLLFLLLGVEAAKANVETFDFTKMGFSHNEEIKEVKGTNITITFNTTDQKYVPHWYSSKSSVVVSDNNIILSRLLLIIRII